MSKADLLRRAKNDLWVAELVLSQELADEFQLDIAAYHVQQAVEKLMKHQMSAAGARYMHTHEVDILFEQTNLKKTPAHKNSKFSQAGVKYSFQLNSNITSYQQKPYDALSR